MTDKPGHSWTQIAKKCLFYRPNCAIVVLCLGHLRTCQDSPRVLPWRYPWSSTGMSHALTVRTVETIKPGPNRKEIPDRHLTGLYLVVQPSGARSLGGALSQRWPDSQAHPGLLSGNRSQDRPRPGQQGIARSRRRPRPRPREGAGADHPPRHGRGRGQAIRRAALPTREPAAHHRGDAAAARSACAAALAASADQGHHPARRTRPARRHRGERPAGRGQPCFDRHPQAVQLGRRARHHRVVAVRRRQAADARAIA